MPVRDNNYQIPAIVCDAEKLAQIGTIQELGKLEIPQVLISKQRNAIGFYSRYATTQFRAAVFSYEQAYIDYLIERIPRGVIFYSNDANAENISRHKARLLAEGFRVLIADYDCIAKVLDKYKLSKVCESCAVKYPKTYLIDSVADLVEFSQKAGFPLIIKSSNLAGGVYKLVKRESEIIPVYETMQAIIASEPFAHRQANLIMQEWIEPRDATLWNFNACVKNGAIVSFSMGERVRTDIKPDRTLGSMLLYGITRFNQEIYDLNERLFRELNYEGLVETEWSISPHYQGAYLYDFNPRPSGNIRWVYRSGVPMADHYYRLNLDLPLNGDLKMTEGRKYYKIFFHDNDFLHAIANPNLSATQALKVMLENIFAVVTYKNHAIDIFDRHDLKPTLKASKGMLFKLLKGFIKLGLKACSSSK